MEKHFTASVYIVDKMQVLLIFHPKFQKWLPPGGHIEPNESSADAARREVFEETGLEIEWILDERVWIQNGQVESFPRPFACLAQDVPSHKNAPAHQHLDFTYLARLKQGVHHPKKPPEHPMKWVSLEQIIDPNFPLKVFPDTKQMLQAIFASPILQNPAQAHV